MLGFVGPNLFDAISTSTPLLSISDAALDLWGVEKSHLFSNKLRWLCCIVRIPAK